MPGLLARIAVLSLWPDADRPVKPHSTAFISAGLFIRGGQQGRITEQTYYRWRKEYGGLRSDQARRLKGLERENARLKKLVAEQAFDNAILKEAAYPNS